jgi:hypothetical protein
MPEKKLFDRVVEEEEVESIADFIMKMHIPVIMAMKPNPIAEQESSLICT